MNEGDKTNTPFALYNGAYFFRSVYLIDDEIEDLLCILAMFVTYSHFNDKTKSKHERSVPDVVLEIFTESRLDGGN